MKALPFVVAGVCALALANAACLTTEVALVTVRNETETPLLLWPRLVGNAAFDTQAESVPAGQEHTIVKYEESRFGAEPISKRVHGLRLEAAKACAVSLDGDAVVRAAERSKTHRRWTIRVTPQLLRAGGCAAK